jgi:hypothetical protein
MFHRGLMVTARLRALRLDPRHFVGYRATTSIEAVVSARRPWASVAHTAKVLTPGGMSAGTRRSKSKTLGGKPQAGHITMPDRSRPPNIRRSANALVAVLAGCAPSSTRTKQARGTYAPGRNGPRHLVETVRGVGSGPGLVGAAPAAVAWRSESRAQPASRPNAMTTGGPLRHPLIRMIRPLRSARG